MSRISDKDIYIYNYLNSKSSTLSFYVPRIISQNTPQKERNYYIERVKLLIAELGHVLTTIEIDAVPVNGFFNELFILLECDIPEVNSLLEKYKYKEVLKNEYVGLLRKVVTKEPLDEKERLCCEFLLVNHLIDDETIFEYFLRGVLLHEQYISYEAFEQLFVDYSKKKMRNYVPDPSFELVSEKYLNGKESYSLKDTIYLCREDVASLYYTGTFKAIKNMLHELGHVKQYKEVMLEKNCSRYALKHIKEEILSAISPGYYDNNYEKICYEIRAEAFSITELLKLLEKFGITFRGGKNPYIQTLRDLYEASKNELRIIDGNEDTVDNIFDYIIIHYPHFLAIYPQLQELYEVTFGDLVVRKDDFGRKD